jgi:hypothetical protein
MATPVTPRQLNSQARDIIRRVYLIGSAPADPHSILTDLARSVTIFGNMLQSLSDQHGKVGNRFASGLATAGKLFWGIVELSVPASVWRYLFRKWLSLFALLSILIIGIGLFAGNSGMWGIGVAMLIAAILLALLSGLLRYYMLKAKIPPHLFRWVRVGLALFALALGAYLAINDGVKIADTLHEFESFFRWTAGLKIQLTAALHRAGASSEWGVHLPSRR